MIVTAPTPTTGINGATISGGSNQNTLFGVLAPHAMVPGVGPAAISIVSADTETFVRTSMPTSGFFSTTSDPVGLSAMAAMAGEMRPVAACIRVACLSADTLNSGLFFGYEGASRQFLSHSTDDTGPYFPAISAQQLILTGALTNTNTFGCYESKINYPNADATWQEFRQVTGAQSTPTGVARSGDASDPDWSQMPIAIVGVTSAIPGAQYLFDGAIVYDWQPKVTLGIDTPAKKPVSPSALASTARSVQGVARQLGGMLVNMASDFASGGSSTAASHMLRLGYNQMVARNTSAPMLGWR